jgi:transposase
MGASVTADGDRTAEVLKLGLVDGLSIRAIAKRLGMARRTVRRVLGHQRPERQSREARPSALDGHLPAIKALLEECPELSAPAMLERLRPLGYRGGVSVLRDRMRVLRGRRSREAFLTLHFHPGEAVQVDWADFGFAIPGCPRRVSAFIMALCHSRFLYLEFTLSQAMPTFLRCMERGLRFYGGTTVADIFDNMKTVVHRPGPPPVFNRRFLAYAGARGFAVRACNPGRGNEKGRVERPVGFVRSRFWPGRRFASLLDLNAQAVAWRDDFANNRVHEVTGKVPSLVFEGEERRLLQPVPATPFDTDEVEPAQATKTFRVRFDRNTYSVPWRLAHQPVVVRATDELVAIYLETQRVAVHRRCWDVGQDIKDDAHEAGLLEQKPRASLAGLPPELAALGELGTRYFKILAAGTRSLTRETVRLTLLVELFGSTATGQAIADVMATGHVGAEYVEYVLRHKRGLRPAPAPLRLGDPELDAIHFSEPDLAVYDQLAPTPMTRDPGELPAEEPRP